MASRTMSLYADRNRREGLTAEQIAFADEVLTLAEANYSDGGQFIVECMTPGEIVKEFKTLADARSYMGLKQEQEDEIRSTIW